MARLVTTFLLCLFVAAPIHAEEGTVALPPLSDDLAAALLEGIISDNPVPIPWALQEPQGPEREVWRSNDPQIDADIGVAEFVFSGTPDGEQIDFRVQAEFGVSQVVLKSSRSGLYNPEGGLVVRGGERRLLTVKSVSDSRLRVALAVPRIEQTGNYALLLCPRFLEDFVDPETQLDRVALTDARINLTSVSLRKLSASVAGKVISGHGAGRAKGQILTSQALPRSSEVGDELLTVDPEISLTYVPVTPIPSSGVHVPYQIGQGIQEGFRLRLELQTGAGYLRTHIFDRVLHVRNITTVAPVNVAEGIANKEAPCVFAVLATFKQVSFGKKELELPAHLKPAEPTPAASIASPK